MLRILLGYDSNDRKAEPVLAFASQDSEKIAAKAAQAPQSLSLFIVEGHTGRRYRRPEVAAPAPAPAPSLLDEDPITTTKKKK